MRTGSEYDFIVIGSGFGGSVSALRLAEKGYSVLVLEMGKRYRSEDFPETNWNLRKYLWNPKLALHGIQAMTQLRDVFIFHGVGVGGGSLVYANTLLVPPDRFFLDPAWRDLADWKEELAPFYEKAKEMLGVVRAPDGAEADRLLAEVAMEMGRSETFHRPFVGVHFNEPGVEPGETVSDPFFNGEGPDRAGCVNCGACMVGCRNGAKNTLDMNYLHLAEKRGVTILPERRVIDVAPAGDGYRVTSIRSTALLRKDKRCHSAKKVIFSAGVLGTMELLLSCRSRGSLPRLSDQLGNFVRTNSETILAVTSRRKEASYSEGIAISAGFHPDENTHIELGRYPEGSDFMSLVATLLTDGGPPIPRILRFFGNILLHPRKFLFTLWPFPWAKRTAILTVMQPLDNYLRLHRRKRWWWPFGRKLDSDRGEGPPIPSYIPIAHEVAGRMAAKMDGVPQNVLLDVLLGLSSTAHILGGCAMGSSPAEGVIDSSNRVFDYEGLYVVDGAMISANLGVNPSLTITAMAERAMSFIPPK